jgi:hypothetical protein
MKNQAAKEVIELLELKEHLMCDIEATRVQLEVLQASKSAEDALKQKSFECFDNDTVGYFQQQSMQAVHGEAQVNIKKNSFLCTHLDKKHYAKNMCHQCYHRKGKSRMADACDHTTKSHYSNGLCQGCYLSQYYMKRKKKLKEKELVKERLATGATFPIAEAVATVELAEESSSGSDCVKRIKQE